MKKLCLLVAVLLLLGTMPITAMAAENVFIIDNENVYEGMDKAYKDGYTPTVSGGTATVVLPLTTASPVAGNTITVTPNLGDVSSSPFVYRNYQKNVLLAENAVNSSETTVSSYLIRFDFTLKNGRVNGVYPVVITVQGKADDNSTIMETFTTYVTITDGTNPNATPEPPPEPEPEPERPIHLSIDNQNTYAGMDKSYSQGYSPTVKNGVASIILPVLADGYLSGNTVTATPDLGDISTSPFIYKSYQKDVKLSSNSVNNGAKKASSYYIRFDLTLAAERYNGVYPVAITVQGKTGEGSIVKETFTAYVTITDGEDPNATAPGTETVHLSIDNRNIYEGMNKSYSQGYSPTVQNGTATIILPVICDGTLKGNTVTATPNLGEPSASPFSYQNYQKDIVLSQNTVNKGMGSVASYYIRFDLALINERFNGVYPVEITVSGKADDGSIVTKTFTAYATITDGKDPNAGSETEAPTSQPIIIVAKHHISPLPVQAGQEITATITLKNTSETKSVQNMTVTAGCDSPNLTLLNDSNVFYIKHLGRGETLDIELKYKTDLETPAGKYDINLAIVYDNSDAQTLSSTGVVTAEVRQQVLVQLETPAIPKEVNAGDTLALSFSVLNLSRGKIFNVRCVLEAPGFIPSGTAFIGNMEAGTAASGDMDVFIGTKDMTEGYEGEDKYGFTSGSITLIYEDAAGQEYTEEAEFSTAINAPVITQTSAPEEEPEKAGQWWISILIGAVVTGGLAALLIIRGKRRVKDHEYV